MSCPHGNHPDACDICDEVQDAYDQGVAHTKREWVGLTDDEIKAIVGPWGSTEIKGYTRTLFDQIEAKLKEKNSG
jgi:hypothetical protein